MSHKKTKYQILNNEKGGMAALLSVIVLSLIMVSTLSSFYIYLENRAKFQGRIQMNYQLGYVMEDLGRAVAQARQQRLDGVCTNVGNGMRYLDCTEVCTVDTGSLAGTVPADVPNRAICVKNDTLNKIVNNADYFCVYNTFAGGVNKPSYCNSLVDNIDVVPSDGAMVATHSEYKRSHINNWYSRLDNFFDTTIVKNAPVLANKMYPILESQIQPPTLLGWMLPEKAYAGVRTSGETLNFCQKYPTDSRCQTQQQPVGVTPPPTDYPPSGGGTVDIGSCTSNPQPSCAVYCQSEGAQPFCKSLEASITVTQIGGVIVNGAINCSTASTDSRCKRCQGSNRRNDRADNSKNVQGECLQIAMCPPWVPADFCVSGGNKGADKRIFQMVRFE